MLPVLRLLLALCALLLLAAPPSQAAVTKKKAIWGPAADRDDQSLFPLYAEMGVGLWQTQLRWEFIAPRTRPANPRDPSDPAYRWPRTLDDSIARAAEQGIEVSALVMGAPEWANGDRPFNGAPRNIADFADFVEAAARRYPEIRHWMIWGEPSKTDNYLPLENGFNAKARAGHYARLLDLCYRRLKKISRSNLVIGGNSFNSSLPAKGYARPGAWIRNLRLPSGKPPRMDMYGHNPFTYRMPNLRDKPQGKDLLDFNDTDTTLRLVDRYISRGGRNKKKLKLFYSEYFVPTDNVSIVNFFVDEATQRRWVRAAYRITRRTKRIYTLGYWKLFDDEPQADNREKNFGLLRFNGERKGGFFGYKAG